MQPQRTRAQTTGIDVRRRKDGTVSFQARVWDARNGRRIRKTFATKTAAKHWRTDAMAAMRNGNSAVPTSHKLPTVAEGLDALLAGMEDGTILDRSGRSYRPATVRSYGEAVRKYLTPALGFYRLPELRRADVQRLVDDMQRKGLAGNTIRNKLDPLRVLFRRAAEDEVITRSPVEKLRLPGLKTKRRQIVTPQRAAELLALLPDSERALWTTLFYAGLRIGEARALRVWHIDFGAGVINVHAGWDDVEGEQDTKTEAGVRVVPMTAHVRSELARHTLEAGRAGEDLVFGRTASEAFVRSTVRARALRAWAQSGHVSPHEARHCAASYFAMAGLSVKEAQEALGHADPRTTMSIYQHALPGWQEQAAAKLDAYLGATVERLAPT